MQSTSPFGLTVTLDRSTSHVGLIRFMDSDFSSYIPLHSPRDVPRLWATCISPRCRCLPITPLTPKRTTMDLNIPRDAPAYLSQFGSSWSTRFTTRVFSVSLYVVISLYIYDKTSSHPSTLDSMPVRYRSIWLYFSGLFLPPLSPITPVFAIPPTRCRAHMIPPLTVYSFVRRYQVQTCGLTTGRAEVKNRTLVADVRSDDAYPHILLSLYL